MPAIIDWYYHRVSDDECKRSDLFLKDNGITIKETVDARKIRYEQPQALAALRKGKRVIASTNGTTVEFDLQAGSASDAELAEHVIGKSGCLRVPALKVGETWLVGFGKEAWTAFFA